MKRKVISTLMVLVFLTGCAGLELNVGKQNLVMTTLETAAFLMGNIGAKQNPIAFAAAAVIAQKAMDHPAWSIAFTEHTVNEMWKEIVPTLSNDPAMTHLAQKWLTILEYNSDQQYIIVPEEYSAMVKTGISEFMLGVQMAGVM